MSRFLAALFATWVVQAHCLPEKIRPLHIIKTRSINLNNAHGLSTETRLEKAVLPTGYKLDLEPYLEDGLFKGHVIINVTWLEESDEVSLHCDHDIQIQETEVKVVESDTERKLAVRRADSDPKKPIYTIKFEKYVPKGTKGQIDLTFTGNMQTTLSEAFFKTTLVNENEVPSIVAAMQLRPNKARRVFPCFDEPGFRTPFELSVVRPRNTIAFSNTPVARSDEIADEPNAVRDHFRRSPPMATYMLGLVLADLAQVGDTAYFKDELGHQIEIRVWCRQELVSVLGALPEKVLRVYKEIAKFWQVHLPLKKLDVIALPGYTGAKPADNWGLLVFKESDAMSQQYLQLAQELCYQWLGALTSPAWWTDAHLNKALVGYLAADIVFKINNGIEMEGKWPMTVLYSIYYEYSKRYPHSLITGMKQETASTKIELLFRMFNYTLGADTFRKGLRMFLEARKLKTFTGDDIWGALNAAAHADRKIPKEISVKTVAESWISKDRLPLITSSRSYATNSVLVSQKVYLRERPHDVPDAANMSWQLPLVVARGGRLDFNNTAPREWLTNKQLDLVDMPTKEHFIIINPEEIGPFPVNYDVDNWNLLLKFLQSKNRTQIPELTRAKLLHDAWNLAYAGELSFATALNMTLFLKEERHHLVWDPVFTMIDHIERHLCQCIQGKFQAYIRSLLSPLHEELSKDVPEQEQVWRRNLRTLTENFLCRAGYKPCIEEAQRQYSKWMAVPNPDEGNPIANQYICPVFKWGTKAEWDFGLQRVVNFPSSRRQSERTYLVKTLAGCPVDEYKISRLLNLTILEGNGNFTETDLFLIFNMLAGTPQGYTTLFHFVSNNWDVLKLKFAAKSNLWDKLIGVATAQFTTQEGLELVSKLVTARQGEFGSAEHIVEKNMRNIKEEAKWSTENMPVIEKWLDAYLEAEKGADDKFEQ